MQSLHTRTESVECAGFVGVCNCSMYCCTLLYVHSSIAIILMGKRELIALLNLSSCSLVMVEWLFLAVPRGSLQFVIVVCPDHTHLLFFCVILATSTFGHLHVGIISDPLTHKFHNGIHDHKGKKHKTYTIVKLK